MAPLTVVARHSLRPVCLSLRPSFTCFYHSYTLPPSNATNIGPSLDGVAETPISQPDPLPRISPTLSPSTSPPSTSSQTDTIKPKSARPPSRLRARKAAMKLTPAAVQQLRAMLDRPDPKLIKIGVRNRGCSGLAYHLEYVDKPGAFDEAIEQDGVKILVDSKALFSIIGSEMDWLEDRLNQRFVFKNPNIKEQCGCGESFMV